MFKKCLDCNHESCPHCQNWCDTIAWSDEDIMQRGIFEAKDADNVYVMEKKENDRFPVLCCGGNCRYE